MTQSGQAGRIFISYRRDDSAYATGWLYDRLRKRFGVEQIFKDVDSLEPGDDFVDKITEAVSSCEVLLVVIGPDWLTVTDEQGQPRLSDSGDFVRLELEVALARQVRVIPLLVEGAKMPRSSQLPETLTPLLRRHALELTSGHFDRDADDLVAVLTKAVASPRITRSQRLNEPEENGPEQRRTDQHEPELRPSEQNEPAEEPPARLSVEQPGRPPVQVAPPEALQDPAPTLVWTDPGPEEQRPEPRRSWFRRWGRSARRRLVLLAVIAVLVAGSGYGALEHFLNGGDVPRALVKLDDDVIVWRRQRDGVYNLATITSRGTGERLLTAGGPADSAAVVSRDRRTILFLRQREKGAPIALYAVSADGKRYRQLFTDHTNDCPVIHRPAWSIKNQLAVVCSGLSPGVKDQLLLMSLDGEVLGRLDQAQLGDPTFTADGRSVIYWRNDAGGTKDGGALYQVATDGSNGPEQLTDGGDGEDADPAVSPQGDDVAFRRTRGKTPGIYMIRAGQGLQKEPRHLGAGGQAAQDPTWSPDASQIAFRQGPSQSSDLWVMNADGTAATAIDTDDEPDGVATWTTR